MRNEKYFSPILLKIGTTAHPQHAHRPVVRGFIILIITFVDLSVSTF